MNNHFDHVVPIKLVNKYMCTYNNGGKRDNHSLMVQTGCGHA